MSTYTPDTWVVIKIVAGQDTLYKVLAGWYGGYAGSDSWKLNSGITHVERDGDYYMFYGYSGSVYRCHKDIYRMSSLTAGVLHSLEYKYADTDVVIEMMPEDTNWLKIDYNEQKT